MTIINQKVLNKLNELISEWKTTEVEEYKNKYWILELPIKNETNNFKWA